MVAISNKEWTDFVAEVRSRLGVIDSSIVSSREMSDYQHEQLRKDFLDLKEEITGKDLTSMENRVRSLEDSRTKMNGVQLGLSAAFSIAAAFISWLLGHPNTRITWNGLMENISALASSVGEFFGRKS